MPKFVNPKNEVAGPRPAEGTTASVQDYLAAIYDLASKRQAGHRRAPGQAHGDLGSGGHRVHPAPCPRRLRRSGRGKELILTVARAARSPRSWPAVTACWSAG